MEALALWSPTLVDGTILAWVGGAVAIAWHIRPRRQVYVVPSHGLVDVLRHGREATRRPTLRGTGERARRRRSTEVAW